MIDAPPSTTRSTVVLRDVAPALLARVVEQHRRAGGVVERAESAPPPPPRASEPGKGALVDVVA